MTTRSMAKRALAKTVDLKQDNITLTIHENSGITREIYEVDIDFDGASEAWRSNKKSLGNGHYKYVCEGFTKTGKKCVREPAATCAFCKLHNKINNI